MSSVKVDHKGPISWMAQNPVAANLVMAIVIIGGIFGAFRSKQEVFPEFSLDMITVQVPYPGASPEEAKRLYMISALPTLSKVREIFIIRRPIIEY